MEVLITMDEEAVKESLAFTTDESDQEGGINKSTFKTMPLKPQTRKIWSKVTKIKMKIN